MNEEEIFKLAIAAGLARNWTDATGKPQKVSPESLRAILTALGFRCASDAECQESHAKLASLQNAETLPPLVTAQTGQPIRLPASAGLAGKGYRIELEEGGRREGRFPDTAEAPELPAIDQYGYHRLIVGETETTLAVAPPCCFGINDALHLGDEEKSSNAKARVWGLGVQLYSLRRAGDGGIGDFTALQTLVRNAAARGASALAISPVHAMFSADATRFSPYSPSSRLFLNALHIDSAAVRGEEALAAAISSLDNDASAALRRLEQEPLIDWPQAGKLRLDLLRALYRQFIASGDDRSEFDSFVQQGGEALQAHARFEALHAWQLASGGSGYWREWPEAYRHPQSAEVRDFAQQHREELEFHAFLQWQAARGLSAAQRSAREAGMPIGLIADLAVGADNGGSQAWSRQEEIITGLSVGAPPDQMNARGQSWGLGAFSPHAMKAKGFHAYIEMLRAVFAHAGGVRIDHVLGLARLWLVPDGASAEKGAYLQYPLDDLLRLIALESWRNRAIVIGEDLGTVPEGFDERLAQAGLLGIRVLFFQRSSNKFCKPSDWSDKAIATTTTHDLPTVAGWWQGCDIDWRVKLDLLPAEDTEEKARKEREGDREQLWRALVESGCASGDMPLPDADEAPVDAAIGFIGVTPALLAILPIEDALGLVQQPNLPGTVDSHPNWRRRLPETVENLLDLPAVSRHLERLNRSRSRSGKH
jgi:4-alpha-glucanotransferase